MGININADGMHLSLSVKGYTMPNKEWYEQWCKVDISFQFPGCVCYEKQNDELFLACEIERICKKIEDLLSGKLKKKETLQFMEPDFELVLEPEVNLKEDPTCVFVKDGYEIVDVRMEWRVFLWDEDHCLTDHYVSVNLKRRELDQLLGYLKKIMGDS